MLASPADGGMVDGIKAEWDKRYYVPPRTMIEVLAHERILLIEPGAKTICLTENCDEYFSVQLTKVEFSRLIDELAALRDQMKE